jgi:hypothetical protein
MEGTMRTVFVAAGTVALVAACASGGAQINSRTNMDGAGPIKRVLVFYNAKSTHFTGALYTNFVSATQRRLESCGLSVTYLEFDPLELEMRKKLTTSIERFAPDAVITIVRSGGNLVSGSGGVSGNLYFDASAVNRQNTKTLWKARIDYRTLSQNPFVDDKQSGEKFAAQFVARMAADRLIADCPPDLEQAK